MVLGSPGVLGVLHTTCCMQFLVWRSGGESCSLVLDVDSLHMLRDGDGLWLETLRGLSVNRAGVILLYTHR